MTNQPTGHLENWYFISYGDDKIVAGQISNDIQNRFDDGNYIRTSKVVAYDERGNMVHTLNSTYTLGKPAKI